MPPKLALRTDNDMSQTSGYVPSVSVVGACNIDLISYVPRMPAIGETLHGTRFQMGFGGKGANQAVMAAKLGAKVTMISKVGRDVFGENTLRNFQKFGIDARHVHATDKAFSGVAPIAVDPEGHNSIVIVTGANDLLTIEEIQAAREEIAASHVLVCQLEVPVEISMAALRLARQAGVRTIFNPAPARPDLPAEIYGLCDIVCPNESETEMLTGIAASSLDRCEASARELLRRGAGTVILTLGERGCIVVTGDSAHHIPAQKVRAVDSTGAGDAFVGSLAYFLANGLPLNGAADKAGAVATRSVLSPGTQTSFPAREELQDLLNT
jgi:ribokinase